MDNTEKARELINKHLYLHGGDGLGITDGDVYRAVLDAVCEALTIPTVISSVCTCLAFHKSDECYKLGCKAHRNDKMQTDQQTTP